MRRIFLFVVLLTAVVMSNTHPALAQGGPGEVYVDPSRTGANEDGSQGSPYNSEKEGEAYAQSLPNGGWLNIKNVNGTWTRRYIPPVRSGVTGDPIPTPIMYVLLGILALALVIAGQYFLRRSPPVHA